MTLVVTALADDVIIMGADSAIQIQYGRTPPNTWTGQQKLFTWQNGRIGGCLYGRFPLDVHGIPFVDWVKTALEQRVGNPDNSVLDLTGTVKALADDLTKVIDQSWSDAVGLHIAGWFQWDDFPGVKIPSMLRVSRSGPRQPYSVTRFPPDDVLSQFHKRYKTNANDYAVYMATDGIAKVGMHLSELNEIFGKVLGVPLQLGNAGAVAGYVRRLISTVAWLYQLTDHGQLVNEPVHIMILPRDRLTSIGIQF